MRDGNRSEWLRSEIGCEPVDTCPYDCNEGGNNIAGEVEATDFLELLNQWTMVGTSCDRDADGVDVTDFLDLLNAWGVCP